MALQKTSVPINFAQGLDLKTDPKQVTAGKFLRLQNSIFDKAGLLMKRNGYAPLTPLPDTSNTFLTTFNGNLTAVGTSLNAFSSASNLWINKGGLTPLNLSTLPLIRSNTNQTQADAVIAANGLVCTVFSDYNGTTTTFKYAIADSVTGQNVVAPTLLVPSVGTIQPAPKVFLLGDKFIIIFTVLSGGSNLLQYVALNSVVPTTPVTAAATITSLYTASTTGAFDALQVGTALYIAWNGASGAGSGIGVRFLDITMVLSTTIVKAGYSATLVSLTADYVGDVTPTVIYISTYDDVANTGKFFSVAPTLTTILAPTAYSTGDAAHIVNLTSTAYNAKVNIIYEKLNTYGYDAAIRTDYTTYVVYTQAGAFFDARSVARSIGLASKAFLMNNITYVLGIQESTIQPSYFLMQVTGQVEAAVIARLAYENGSTTYYTTGLPNALVSGDTVSISYLIKDLVQAVNKDQTSPSSSPVYAQTGINMATFTFNTAVPVGAEIGENLNLSGGMLWAYDGYLPVEQGFHLFPENVEAVWSAVGGSMAAKPDGATNTKAYAYQATYEWSDNQGNLFRSAPSVPIFVTTTGALSTGSVTLFVPTLRLTYKTANPVKIVVYRWSVAQQTYHQVTSITSPTLNTITQDYATFVDTLADASIIGNNILYTTGGVIENIAAPSFSSVSLFKSRLFGIDSEDTNLLWYSKQVIESVPVEMSDLLTIFVAPTVGAQGDTGSLKALSAMDDKLVLFKKNAIYYITGTGPDNTGANNDFSEPTFITSTVGCENQQSIVFMPSGLMFQSDKGIWLLGRDLSTQYIGAPVETLTQNALVQSAVNVPSTNQIRFTLDSGITLMYDYYFGQWGSFVNVPAVSSTIYQGLHTFINNLGSVLQESAGIYVDNGRPVLMAFTTGSFNLAGLQGFERAYYFYLIGTYLSPHKLTLSISYDYNDSPTQVTVISPDNFAGTWGSDGLYGGAPVWGGSLNDEQWRIFLQQQKCQAFSISLDESFDATYGTAPGAGFTLSGLDIVVAVKKGYPTLRASRSAG